jgi:branched-subunit amino acid ABC-type transport system permease component
MLVGIQQIIIDVITNGLTIAAMALAFILAFRAAGVFNAGYGALFVGAGYIFGGSYAVAGLPLALAFGVTAVISASAMGALDYFFRRIGGSSQHSPSDRSLIASVGVALIVEHACGLAFGSDVWSVSTFRVSQGFSVSRLAFFGGMSLLIIATYSALRRSAGRLSLGVVVLGIFVTVIALSREENGVIPRGRLWEALLSLCCLIVIATNLRSRRGIRWYAFLSSPATARLLGFNWKWYRLCCVLAAGAVTGLVSAARVMNAGVRPDESWRVLIAASFVALLANRVSAVLLALAGITYAFVSYLAVLAFSSTWRDAISFSLLFILIATKSHNPDVETAPSEA